MNTTTSINSAALLLRVSLGAMWLSHSLVLKVATFTMPGFQSFLVSQGLPAAMAWPMVIAEVAGGLMILLGIHGRLASVALLPILVGATWIHAGNGWVFSAQGGGWEFPVFLIAASVVHALLGDGDYRVRIPTALPDVLPRAA